MYRIEQGDCIELMKSIPDKSIDMIFTDPPYLYLKHKLDAQFDISLLWKGSKFLPLELYL